MRVGAGASGAPDESEQQNYSDHGTKSRVITPRILNEYCIVLGIGFGVSIASL